MAEILDAYYIGGIICFELEHGQYKSFSSLDVVDCLDGMCQVLPCPNPEFHEIYSSLQELIYECQECGKEFSEKIRKRREFLCYPCYTEKRRRIIIKEIKAREELRMRLLRERDII